MNNRMTPRPAFVVVAAAVPWFILQAGCSTDVAIGAQSFDGSASPEAAAGRPEEDGDRRDALPFVGSEAGPDSQEARREGLDASADTGRDGRGPGATREGSAGDDDGAGDAGANPDSGLSDGGTTIDGGDAASLDPTTLVGRSFALKTLPWGITTNLHFTSATATTLLAVFGNRGLASEARFEAADGGPWIAAGPIAIFYERFTSNPGYESASLSNAVLSTSNSVEGGPTSLVVSGRVDFKEDTPDFKVEDSDQATVVASELEGPRPLAAYSCDLNPLGPNSILLDAPLQPSATATLTPQGGIALAMTSEIRSNAVTAFTTSLVLPPATTFQLSSTGAIVSGAWKPTPITCTTPAVAVAPTDGFESGAVTGSAVSNADVPPIQGKLSWKGGALRLVRPAGVTKLVFLAQRIEQSDISCPGAFFTARAGAVGSEGSTVEIELGRNPTTVTYDGHTYKISAIQKVEIPLAGESSDVLFKTAASTSSSADCSPTVLPWIDDVHFE